METATGMTAMGRVLDGLSRAAVLLKEHDDQAPPIVTVTTSGKVELFIGAAMTFSEESRRHSADVYAEATHSAKPTVQRGYYISENEHWRISTAVKSAHCQHCGGAR